MSGLDEQNIDFPKCPNCNKNEYWVAGFGNSNINGVCFNREEYMQDRDSAYPKIFDSFEVSFEDLDTIEKFSCNSCRWDCERESVLFSKIITLGKKYFRMRNKDVWIG